MKRRFQVLFNRDKCKGCQLSTEHIYVEICQTGRIAAKQTDEFPQRTI